MLFRSGAFSRTPRWLLNFAVLVLAVFLLAFPSFWIMGTLHSLAEDVFHALLAR